MAERRGGTVEGVRDLFVSTSFDGDSSTLPRLLKSIPHLLNLYCDGGTIMVDDLAPLQRLRRLEMRSGEVAGSPSSSVLCLPHLQRLSMMGDSLEGSASHFLTPACLPQLRRIDNDDFDSITPLIPQFEIITFNLYNVDNTLLSRAKSLLLLPLSRFHEDRFAMFSNLPSLPPFLHVASDMFINFDHQLPLALEDVLEVKCPGLRIIF